MIYCNSFFLFILAFVSWIIFWSKQLRNYNLFILFIIRFHWIFQQQILRNYEDILRKNQYYLQDKSKLKIALSGLVRCLSLLPCNQREADSCEKVPSDFLFIKYYLICKESLLLSESFFLLFIRRMLDEGCCMLLKLRFQQNLLVCEKSRDSSVGIARPDLL